MRSFPPGPPFWGYFPALIVCPARQANNMQVGRTPEGEMEGGRMQEVGQCMKSVPYTSSEQPPVQHKQGFLHTRTYKHTHLKTYSLADHRNVAGVSLHGGAVPASLKCCIFYWKKKKLTSLKRNNLSNKVIRSAWLIETPKLLRLSMNIKSQRL